MTKSLKRIIVGAFSAVAFLLAGLFFASCGYDTSRVTVTPSVSSLTLELGGMNESQDVTFTINNAPNGFSRTLRFNVDNEGVVNLSSPVYNDNEVTITVSAVAGGSVNIMAITEEGYRYTTISVNVIQHSETLTFDESSLYLSNSTPFVANNGYYYFDSNTTDKDMTFYYIAPDVTNMTFQSVSDNEIVFVDTQNNVVNRFQIGSNPNENADAYIFDTAYIDEENENIVFTLNGEITGRTESVLTNFTFLAFYNYSINYTSQLACVNQVSVLEDLELQIEGGYLLNSTDGNTGNVEFGEVGENIMIVPNSENYTSSTYILKVNVLNNSDLIDFNFSLGSNNLIDVDMFDYQESDVEGQVYYLRISHLVFDNISTNLNINVKYNMIDDDIQDESVNISRNFGVEIVVAPKEILINGRSASEYSSEDNPITLYNRYRYPEFGWQELLVSVSANTDASPVYSYAYIEFNTEEQGQDLEFQYNSVNISSNRPVYDLSTPFYFRGIEATERTDHTEYFTIYVVCEDILDGNGEEYVLSVPVYYEIVEGATVIERNLNMGDGTTLYLDYRDSLNESIFIGNYLYADALFQSISFEFLSGTDVVTFDMSQDCCLPSADGESYYLNFGVRSRMTGTGVYNILLDNGTSTTVTFTVIDTMKPETTSIEISDIGNIAFYERLSSSEDVLYSDILNLELLNPTTQSSEGYVVEYNQFSSITFSGNIQSVTSNENVNAGWVDGVVRTNALGNTFQIETLSNGQTTITFLVSGYVVNPNTYTRETDTYIFTVNIISYSLLSEFVFLNNGRYAVDNVVYYGDSSYIPEEDRQVSFTIRAETSASYNFYQYSFTDLFLNDFMTYFTENWIPNEEDNELRFSIDNDTFDDYLISNLVAENYDNKFIYYYVVDNLDMQAAPTSTIVTISIGTYVKDITIQFQNGFMFFVEDDIVLNGIEYDGQTYNNVRLSFTNQFYIGQSRYFDLNTLTYVHEVNQEANFTIHSFVSQRDYTQMRYDINIVAERYTPVTDISTASVVDEIVFTNSNLEESFVIYVTPQNATNSTLRYEYVPNNVYSNDLVQVTIVEQLAGTYVVTVSAQEFYDTTSNVDDITETLAGKIYIYPIEWGQSASVIDDHDPVEIDVSYRNGSENNRYILETPDDVMAIGTNEKTLSSHYEIRNLIDLSNLMNVATIGLSTDTLIGFSGSIVGTTSQAGISGVNLVSTAGSESLGIHSLSFNNINYYGLFAEIEEGAYLKNLTISGSINTTLVGDYNYVGLIAGVNYGKFSNVSVNIENSSRVINTATNAYIGGMVGFNYGEIKQYFPAYNVQEYAELMQSYAESGNDFYYTIEDVAGEFGFNNQSVKNLAYYSAKLIVNAYGQTYVGGVAGATSGNITKVDDETLSIYGYSTYSAYVNIEIVDTNSDATDNTATVNAGGIAGYAESIPVLNPQPSLGQSENDVQPLVLENLIVGGEVDCQYVATLNDERYQTAVGGIVGFGMIGITENKVSQNIHIYDNISRVFVRGYDYVGGIIGVDNYGFGNETSSGYGNSAVILYNEFDNNDDIISSNSVEAVDDGRSAYDASMFMIYTDGNEGKLDVEGYSNNTIIAIGNAVESQNAYLQSTNVSFEVLTYVSRGEITSNNYSQSEVSTSIYYGDYLVIGRSDSNYNNIIEKAEFTYQPVNIGLTKDDFRLTGGDEYVYLTYYFNVAGLVSSQSSDIVPQDIVDELNTYSPINQSLYPFAIDTRDAEIISTSSGIINVDINGNITTMGEGLATFRLQSILNVQETIDIYLYVVNFFNKDVKESVFYTANSSNLENNIIDNTGINVYGSRQTSIYAVATYDFEHKTGVVDESGNEEVDWSVSRDGILRYKDISFRLEENTSLKVSVQGTNGTEGNYTRSIVNGQQVTFIRKDNVGEGVDTYTLSAYLETTINGSQYRMTIGKESDGDVSVNVRYRETATNIYTASNMISMETNETFNDKLFIESINEEFAYYQIFMLDDGGEVLKSIQSKMDATGVDNFDEWLSYVNVYDNANDLFILRFERDPSNDNVFNFYLSVNRESEAYQNKGVENIYGTYKIVFYANELENGVFCEYIFNLSEAKITNLVVDNYSNINDISIADQVIVPSQYGILEISVDPVDAEFESFTISNNTINYNEGAGEAVFTFVYQTSTNGVPQFVPDIEFGNYRNGTFAFTYDEMIDYFNELNTALGLTGSDRIEYNGRIYIRYLLSSSGVEDGMPITFDISMDYMDNGLTSYETQINLTTKLANYVNLSFDDRNESDVYYVARGLSYGMTLDYYGFGLSDIQITVSNPDIATLTGENRNYNLNITSNEISYTGDVGYRLVINVYASRIVDNVTIEYSQEIVVYVMEYVFNYQYVEGVNEDLVRGMNDGVISTAIGNAYTLSFDVWDFMEYDSSNAQVVASVENFINNLTNSVVFQVHNNVTGITEALETGKGLRDDYYIINGYTFTAIRLYEPSQDIYYFTASGQYAMSNGVYICEDNSNYEQHEIYTAFTFSIHQQSTDDSPLPIESYEDFLNMEEGEYYILLNDITLPNEDSLEYDQFTPLDVQVAGFDGNGYSIMFGGNYSFDSTVLNAGVFTTIGNSTLTNDVVFKNITIDIVSTTNFVMTANSFTVGLLAATNDAIITNCQVISSNNSAISITYTNTVSGSYVAGLVGNNNGIITNSMTSIDILTSVNLAGFVGTNTGTISSSTFRGGSLTNDTNLSTEYTAGFVLQNSGEIYTSYVSGVEENIVRPNNVYYQGDDDFIQSRNTIAGFVFLNSGLVRDCYTNINMQEAGSFSAGFVFMNETEGEIRSSFSTSILSSYNTQSFGFARANSGYIWDSYYLSQFSTISESNVDTPIVLTNVNGIYGNDISVTVPEDVNVSISTLDANPDRHNVRALSLREFTISDGSNFEENFKNFTHTTSRNYNSVWFYNYENSSSTFNGKVFNVNRLELVAPNITAFSQRYLYSTEEIVDSETGITTVKYNYANTEAAGETGSAYNPILLDRAETFENYILNENDRNNYNFAYYRIINNIDYSEFTSNSQLYTTRFMGYIEGNFLTVSNMHMVSSSSLQLAGLFAEVGSSSRVDAIGTLLNFNFEPVEMVFTNAQAVGAIAGRLDSGTIANVNVLSNNNMMITGRNIVGGLVGVAIGNYLISNVESSLSARATYIAGENNNFNSSSTVYRYYSFAGSVIGVASGSGQLNQIEVNSGVSIIGAKVGGLVGFIDQNVTARELTLTITDEFVINAFNYGGLVAGESAGTVSEVNVVGTGSFMQIFSMLPYTPSAVGGFAGLVSGGIYDNINISQSLDLSDTTSTTGILSVGGFAGLVNDNTEMNDIHINASFTAFMTLGGLIGTLDGELVSLSITNFSYNGNLNILSTSVSEVNIGGVIGLVDSQASITIDATLSENAQSDIQTAIDNHANYENVESSITNLSTLSTDFAVDTNGVLSESYRNSSNTININSEITIYVYNANSIINYGEIVGVLGAGSIDVKNTISTSTVVAGIYDMVSSSFEENVATLAVVSGEYKYSDGVSEDPLTAIGFTNELEGNISHRILSNGGYVKESFAGDVSHLAPVYSQNITFTTYTSTSSVGGVSYRMNVNNIGACVDNTFLGIVA